MKELGHALGQIGLRLERGLQDAERELSEARERCGALESEIRSIRAALEALDMLDAIEAGAEPVRTEHVEVRDERAELVISMPAPAPEIDPANGAIDEAVAAEATDPTGSTDGAARGPEPTPVGDQPPSVPAYLPMLEELWAIARREDD